MAAKTMLVCHFIAEWGGTRINFSEVSGFVWKLIKAFPVRYSGPILNSQSDAVAMEELEIAHEGLVVVH